MVVAISLAYVAYGGLWWMQALFYAIGAPKSAITPSPVYWLMVPSKRCTAAALLFQGAPGRQDLLGEMLRGVRLGDLGPSRQGW